VTDDISTSFRRFQGETCDVVFIQLPVEGSHFGNLSTYEKNLGKVCYTTIHFRLIQMLRNRSGDWFHTILSNLGKVREGS